MVSPSRVRFILLLAVLPIFLLQIQAQQRLRVKEAGYLSNHQNKVVPGELLVKFRAGLKSSGRIQANATVGATTIRSFKIVPGLELTRVPAGADIYQTAALYRQNPNVEYVEPNYRVQALGSSNDPLLASQWSLQNTGQMGGTAGADIKATQAWSLSTGSSSVVVAVIDSGIDYNHPDLAANTFTNAADCNNNGIDDDGNGYVDDCHGIAPVNGNSDPMDDNGHGTHVSGTIGAVGNNGIGVSGVNWDVGILACKFLNSQGSGTTADAISCLEYVKAMKDRGVNIIATNNSWGGTDYSQALHDAIAAQMQDGILFIAAAGNDFTNNDELPVYPASYDLPNIIAVAATDRFDQLSYFSNVGAHSVAVGAPGDQILSTLPGATYGYDTGTSMATPHVTGVAALLKAQDPTRDWRAIKNLILASGDPNSALANQTITGRRLNAYGAMTCSSATVAKRLLPTMSSISGTVGTALTLRMLNINCAAPAGSVQVTVPETGETIALVDDGSGADAASGDGVYSGQWTPSARGNYTLVFPNGDNVTVDVLGGYGPAPTTSTYQTISGTNLNLSDDSVATVVSPFPVQFGGGTFSKLYVSSNGTISFSNQFDDFLAGLIPVTDPSVQTLVAPYWDDLYPVPGTAHNVFWDVTGTAPNRQLVIEWRDVQQYRCKFDPSATMRFEVVLSESTNNVQFNYADVTLGSACSGLDRGGRATVGIETSPTQGYAWSALEASLQDGMSLLWQLDFTPPTNSSPTVTTVSPTSFSIGSPASTITVNGANFVPDSKVQWNLQDRPTTYVSATQLQAQLFSYDFSPTAFSPSYVYVENPGGALSNGVSVPITSNPPTISSISPSSVMAGSFGFTLVINGSNFVQESSVQWNGNWLSSRYISPNTVWASVYPEQIATAGTAQITVVNPDPGGSSAPATLTITPVVAGASVRYPILSSSQSPVQPQEEAPFRFLGWNFARLAGNGYLNRFGRTYGGHADKSTATALGDGSSPRSFNSTSLPGLNLRPSLPAGFIPTGVAAGDFNRDGHLDWVVSNGGSNNLWLYLGKGDGTAQLPTIIPITGVSPVWIITADLRHNGILDLIVAEADSGSIGVMLGNGDGTFQPERTYYINGIPTYLVAGDFDGDGNVDVVAALVGGDSPIVTLAGLGTGGFKEPEYSAPALSGISPVSIWLSVADLDGDGKPDLVVTDSSYFGGVFAFLNHGDGTFKFSTVIVENFGVMYLATAAGDLNHDGCADIVAMDSLARIWEYQGHCNGTFTDQNVQYGPGEFLGGLSLVDVNADGNLDVVGGGVYVESGIGQSAGNLLSVMLGDGSGKLANPKLYRGELSAYSVAFGDVNGDGHIDIIAANQDSDSATVFLNDGKGGFGDPSGEYVGILNGPYSGGPINSPLTDVTAADVNGDGKPDLVSVELGKGGSDPNTLSVTLNDGSGNFGPPINSPILDSRSLPTDFALADFRKIGHPDLVITSNGSWISQINGVWYAKGNGDGTFALPVRLASSASFGVLGVGDFNGDGKLDFVALGGTGGSTGDTQQLTVFLGNGDGTFSQQNSMSFGGTATRWPVAVFVGDFNGDHKLDLLVRLYENVVPYTANDVYEFLGNGNGTFQSPVVVIPNSNPIAVADVNHDGLPDIVEYHDPLSDFPNSPNQSQPKVNVYLCQPNGSFSLTNTYTPYPPGVAVVLLNQGTVNGTNPPPWLGDFNGDGSVDVAVYQRDSTGPAGSMIQFLIGNGDGTFTPTYSINRLQTTAIPQALADVNGDGRADLIETEFYSSAFNVLLGGNGAPLRAEIVGNPVVGNDGTLRLTFDVPPPSGTTLSLASSEPAIVVPASITATGAVLQDVPFTIASTFNANHVFSIQTTMGTASAIAYGTKSTASDQLKFRIYTASTIETAALGGITNDYQVGAVSLNGYSTSVTLGCANLPTGASCVFGQPTLQVSAGQSAETSFKIQTSTTTPPGTYTVNVTGTDGVITSQASVTLSVDDFNVTVDHNSVSARPTGTTTVVVSTKTFTGFSGSANLSCANTPPGMSCTFSPASVSLGSSSTLSIQTNSAAFGNYNLDIIANDGTTTHGAQLAVVVNDFTGSVSPTTANISVGNSSTFLITLTPQNGFADSVTLSCPGLPSGVECSFDRPTVTFDGTTNQSVQLTIKVTSKPSLATGVGKIALLIWGGSFGILGFLVLTSRKKRGSAAFLALSVLLIVLQACGGGSTPPPPPPTSTTVTVKVQAVDGSYMKELGSITVTVK